LQNWPDYASSLRDSFCNTFNCKPEQFSSLAGFSVGKRKVIVVHPLWDVMQPHGLVAEAASTASADTNLLPTWEELRTGVRLRVGKLFLEDARNGNPRVKLAGKTGANHQLYQR